MLYYIFTLQEEDFQAKNTQTLQPTAPLYQVLVCKTHVFPSLLQFWKCVLEENVLAQNQLDGWENIEEVMYLQGIIMRALRYQENYTIRYWEML